jgi:hypothetical protein
MKQNPLRFWLQAFFVLVLVTMLVVTTLASLERNVLEALKELWGDLWFRATLADTYFAFLTIWLWMAYREPTWARRLAWLVAVVLLGNFAIAAYGWLALRSLPEGAPLWQVFLRPEHRSPSGA